MRKIVLLTVIVSFVILGSAGVYLTADAEDIMDKGKSMMQESSGAKAGEMMEKGKSMMQESSGAKAGEMMEKRGMMASEAGNAANGKSLFNNPKAFDGSGEMSCSSCHPDGKGLEKAGAAEKTEWKTPVAVMTSLEDAINVCILMANKGKAIDPKSDEMIDIISYIQSLGTGKSMGMQDEMEERKSDMMEKMKKKAPGY